MLVKANLVVLIDGVNLLEVNFMSPKDAMKNRKPICEMKEDILAFCENQPNIEVAVNNGTDFPIIEKANYIYIDGKHILLLVGVSTLLNVVKDTDKISGLIFDKDGKGLKMSKRIYGKFTCKALDASCELLQKAAEVDAMYKKMLNHGAKFFELELIEATVYFSGSEIFTLDSDWNPSFSKYTLSGKERFENSRHILMTYGDRDVIFNTIIEDGVYYTLTNANSNKIEYIKNGGICKIYDGRDNHFDTKIQILSEDKVIEIDSKLRATNNAFFKNTENLLALSFAK